MNEKEVKLKLSADNWQLIRAIRGRTGVLDFLRGRLVGIAEICTYTGRYVPDIMDWIFHDNFPAQRIDGIWVGKKGDIRRWFKKRNLNLRSADAQIRCPLYRRRQAKRKRERW